MKQYPVAKEGWPFLAVLGAISIITYQMFYMWAILPTILFLFTGYFFRNPFRAVPATENIIVAPADRVIINIEEQYEGIYMEEDAIKISIFLSLFNVHINRSPCEGTVDFIQRVPGKFVVANRKDAGTINSRNYLGLKTPLGESAGSADNRFYRSSYCMLGGRGRHIGQRSAIWTYQIRILHRSFSAPKYYPGCKTR